MRHVTRFRGGIWSVLAWTDASLKMISSGAQSMESRKTKSCSWVWLMRFLWIQKKYTTTIWLSLSRFPNLTTYSHKRLFSTQCIDILPKPPAPTELGAFIRNIASNINLRNVSTHFRRGPRLLYTLTTLIKRNHSTRHLIGNARWYSLELPCLKTVNARAFLGRARPEPLAGHSKASLKSYIFTWC